MRNVTRRQAIARCLPALAFGLSPLLLTRSIWGLGTASGPSNAELEQMEKLARSFMRRFDVPGLSVAVAHDGQIAYESAFGDSDYRSHQRLTTQDHFRIASLSKAITSAAIFRLTETTKLTTNDKVFGSGGILGADFGKAASGEYTEDITVEHLLTHTCGEWANDENDPMSKFRDLGAKDLITWTLKNRPLTSPPGKKWAYSNFGYCILGRVIEKTSGKPYHRFVQDAIFRPCQITTMEMARNSPGDRAAQEVTYYGQSGENPYTVNVSRMDSNGGWLATAADLARFASHVDGFDENRNILKRETIEMMVAPVHLSTGKDYPHRLYARGWFVNDNALDTWYHDGSLPGTTTILKRTPSRLCIAALTNTRRQPSQILSSALFSTIDQMVTVVGVWN
jgi:CubicO group peptidase (beta-lactamase class C family)